MDPVTEMNVAFLFSLVISHLVADFVLQPDRWVEDKIKNTWHSFYLYIHSFIAGALALVPTLYFYDWILAAVVFFVVLLTHFVIDGFKAQLSDEKGSLAACKDVRLFTIDQFLHLLVLILIWWVARGLDPISSGLPSGDPVVYNGIVILLGYLFVLWPGGIFIGKLMACIGLGAEADKNGTEDDGLKNAGAYIGYLERLLILSFILADQYVAIGFLVGAKAIFRYTDSREVSEYILTGTLLSYSLAVIVGMIMVHLLV